MSQKEYYLSDGRKTSDLKVTELKKELEKLKKSKSGIKDILVSRLNEALEELSEDKEKDITDDQVPEAEIHESDLNAEEKVNEDSTMSVDECDRNFSVDLDNEKNDGECENNLHPDTLDIDAPIDESLNPIDDSTADESLCVGDINTVSNNDKAEEDTVKSDVEETITVGGDIEDVVETNDRRVVMKSSNDDEIKMNESGDVDQNVGDQDEDRQNDEMYEVYIDAQMETIESDMNNDMREKKRENVIAEGTMAMEEGEVLPISARLGKRQYSNNDNTVDNKKKCGLKETKATGHRTEEPRRVNEAQKSKNIISDVLRIDNLVRPFTVGQLRDMLILASGVTVGSNVISDVWLNKIKSIAYVCYHSESVAILAREYLDGCRWPSINPKLLSVDFSTREEMDYMRTQENGGRTNTIPEPSATMSVAPNTITTDTSNVTPHVSIKDRLSKRSIIAPVDDIDKWNDVNDESNIQNSNTAVRRVDLTSHQKRGKNRSRSPLVRRRLGATPPKSDDRMKRNNKSDISASNLSNASHDKEKNKEKAAKPTKLLEDIFRKTVAQPAIYWLPVTKEKRDEMNKPKESVRTF